MKSARAALLPIPVEPELKQLIEPKPKVERLQFFWAAWILLPLCSPTAIATDKDTPFKPKNAPSALTQHSTPSQPSSHWAFQPPARPKIPPVKDRNWMRNPIDAFVLARLEKEKIKPSPEADRVTLIRRLTLDLLGLPPSLEEVKSFVQDAQPDAYERLVDRLL